MVQWLRLYASNAAGPGLVLGWGIRSHSLPLRPRIYIYIGFPGGAVVKNSPANTGDARTTGSTPGSGRCPGGENGNPFSILGWKIPWTEEPGGLQPLGLQRVRHD